MVVELLASLRQLGSESKLWMVDYMELYFVVEGGELLNWARHLLEGSGEVVQLPPQRSDVVLFGKVWLHFRTVTMEGRMRSRQHSIERLLRYLYWGGSF